jgi:hypothetical protein
VTGWLRIDIPSVVRSFAVTPCSIEGCGHRYDEVNGLLSLDWSLLCGSIAEIPGDYSDLGILLLETGYPLLVGPGTYLKL